MIKDIVITKLKVISGLGGHVMHAIKKTDNEFYGFGEAYFSYIQKGAIKGWKRHKEMTLNLTVPIGKIRFVLFDDRKGSNIKFQEVIISKDNYCRLTVPPMIWMAFQSFSEGESLLLNIANIEHDPDEVERKNIEQIKFDWSK
jgi:dTDP-4-dehydrorhamnose 3,5-epimerase